MPVETSRIGVFSKAVGVTGTPVSLGGSIIPAIVGKTYGKEITVEDEAVVRGAGNRDSLANTTVSRVTNVSLSTTGSGDFEENIHFTVEEYQLDWSDPATMQPPDVDTLSTESGSATWASTGTYEVVATALDYEGNETTQSPAQTVSVANTTNNIVVSWAPVFCADKYRIYVRKSGGSWSYDEIDAPTTTCDLDGAGTATNPPSTNSAKIKPEAGATYYVTYVYNDLTADSESFDATLFYDLGTVESIHGVGSPISKAASLILNSTDGAGHSVVMLVGYQNDTYSDFATALAKLEVEEIDYVSGTMDGFQIAQALDTHCRLCSGIARKKERIGYAALNNGLSIGSSSTPGTYAYKAYSLNSEYACIVVPEGGAIQIRAKGTDGTIVAASVGGYYAAIAAMGAKSAFNDPAEPLTNKQIRGITALGTKWNDDQVDTLRDAGALVIRDVRGIFKCYHGITTNRQTVEKREENIKATEQHIQKKYVRPAVEEFIGRKLLGYVLIAIRDRVRNKLDLLVKEEKIVSYDSAFLSVRQNPTVPTNVIVSFRYSPVYGINNIVFEYSYDLESI